jgi:hypothetical protein
MNPFWLIVEAQVSDPGGVDPVTGVLLQYGAVGVVALMALIAVKVLFSRLSASLDRETQRADRLEEELRRLNEAVRTDYIGALGRSSQAVSEANRAVADVVAQIRRG